MGRRELKCGRVGDGNTTKNTATLKPYPGVSIRTCNFVNYLIKDFHLRESYFFIHQASAILYTIL